MIPISEDELETILFALRYRLESVTNEKMEQFYDDLVHELETQFVGVLSYRQVCTVIGALVWMGLEALPVALSDRAALNH